MRDYQKENSDETDWADVRRYDDEFRSMFIKRRELFETTRQFFLDRNKNLSFLVFYCSYHRLFSLNLMDAGSMMIGTLKKKQSVCSIGNIPLQNSAPPPAKAIISCLNYARKIFLYIRRACSAALRPPLLPKFFATLLSMPHPF